jgi:hypothetical protein
METHEYLVFQSVHEFDAAEFEAQLKHRRDNLGETVFTGAYMVSGYNQMGSSDKVENVAALFDKLTANPDFLDRVLAAETLEEAYDLIRGQPGFGNFLSYQVLVDLLYPVDAYDGESVLPFSPDDWSSPGPGAQKGLKQLVTEFNGFDRLAVMRWLRQHQQEEFDRLGLDFPFLETEEGDRLELSLANIQNCLCEFYKYHKILHSNGRARRCFRDSEARSGRSSGAGPSSDPSPASPHPRSAIISAARSAHPEYRKPAATTSAIHAYARNTPTYAPCGPNPAVRPSSHDAPRKRPNIPETRATSGIRVSLAPCSAPESAEKQTRTVPARP